MPFRHAVVTTALAHLQARPDHRSELKSQRAAGEVLQILDRRGTWVLASGFDGYAGWVRVWSLRFLSDRAARTWARAAQAWASVHTLLVQRTPGGDAVAALPFGARLRALGPGERAHGDRYLPVALASGTRGFARRSELGFGSAGADPIGTRAARLARLLRGAPYLWGGTSSWGVDCSGLVQLAYALSGVILPRDTRDQIRITRPLVAGEAAEPGDLCFFGRGGGVNHVAMVTRPDRFVHAYGRVEEATLVPGKNRRPELAAICLGIRRPLVR
jgi:gamma-D-glutamyl-L-lysine dipeptidyl-peptidase